MPEPIETPRPTLILPPRYAPDTVALVAPALAAGWRVRRLANWRAPMDVPMAGAKIYGEPLFAEAIAQQMGLALLDVPADWLPNVPRMWTHRRIERCSLGEARTRVGPMFAKPAGMKSFRAGVVAHGRELPASEILAADTPVQISEPVRWRSEFRTFVLDGRVVAASPYLRDGELVVDDAGNFVAPDGELASAIAFANEFAAALGEDLPPAIAVDVGRLAPVDSPDAAGDWAVIEANAAWGSGLYGCDPAAILPVIERAILPADAVPERVARWVLQAGSEAEDDDDANA